MFKPYGVAPDNCKAMQITSAMQVSKVPDSEVHYELNIPLMTIGDTVYSRLVTFACEGVPVVGDWLVHFDGNRIYYCSDTNFREQYPQK